jgi:hypothetical protein
MISLRPFGIDFEGPVEAADAAAVPEVITRFDPKGSTLWTQDRRRYLEEVESTFVGGYGIVYTLNAYERLADNRLKFIETMYEKRSKKGGTDLFLEACLQILAYNKLSELGYGYAIAQTRDLLRWPDGDISFTMKPFNDVKNMHEMMESLIAAGLKGRAFDMWWVPLFVQTVVLMGLLEEHLRLNHRDLKGDNILVSLTGSQKQKEVMIGDRRWSYIYRQELHVVDFGFACRGTADQGPASASAGTFFGQFDVCPKGGRDIYILLCYFYAQSTFRASASPTLLDFVKERIGRDDILRHLELHGTKRTKQIYLMLGSPEFQMPATCCTPILTEIATRWPALLSAA